MKLQSQNMFRADGTYGYHWDYFQRIKIRCYNMTEPMALYKSVNH